ncbi:hypothetical protein CK556_03285 [Mesoplasma chauliocola]|uniref:Uncharacterized protein n=1 Tax=Mesoplasma chauliocola TaxID=216427 RepID=A0A249SP32_9MOLU|nr:hypothetical protein CK556_03285 [Mesoplasma chauliocola]
MREKIKCKFDNKSIYKWKDLKNAFAFLIWGINSYPLFLLYILFPKLEYFFGNFYFNFNK